MVYFNIQRRLALLLLALLLFATSVCLATPATARPVAAHLANGHTVSRRAEAAGSECSTEGQWNCMTTSWQRCASGVWSLEMAMAQGTRCSPAGLTDDFHIEHDGSANGSGGNGGSQALMMGPGHASRVALCMAAALTWAHGGGRLW
jgi:hypothetical protein